MKVAVLDDYQDVAVSSADWSPLNGRAAVHFFHDHVYDTDALVDRLMPYEALVLMRERTPLSRSTLGRLRNLQLVVTTGPRNRMIDLAAASERGIVVSATEGLHSPTVELTWALILALVRNLPTELSNVAEGGWQTTVGTMLDGKRLAVLGLGRLGARVARIGAAFGMEVVAWSQNLTPPTAAARGATWVTKEELFATADVLTIHLVLSERTRGLVGAAQLAQMKPTAYLINTSRGPIVDEDALAAALEQRRIAGAAIDVFGQEPLPPEHRFRRLSHAITTPHIGYVTADEYRLFYRQVVEDIEAYLDGTPIRVLNANT